MMVMISVIVPVYNTSHFLRKCLDSIQSQSFGDFELIVVNDGSTDNSLDIIQEYEHKFNSFILINKKNEGLPAARNSGLKKAKGKYIIHLDSDDWVENDYFKCVQMHMESKNLDILLCDFIKDYGNKKVVITEGGKGISNRDDYLMKYFSGDIYPATWNKVYRRDLYLKHNITYPNGYSIGEDLATTPLLAYHANNIGYINKAFVHYMQHSQAMTKAFKPQGLRELYTLLLNQKEFFSNKYNQRDINNFIVRQLSNSYFFSKKVYGCDDIESEYLKLVSTINDSHKYKLRKFLSLKLLKKFPYKNTIRVVFYMNYFFITLHRLKGYKF